MRTTIDGAGRIVVPKPLRDALGLSAGRAIDVVFADGRLEIELAPVEGDVQTDGALPRLVPEDSLPRLTDDDVRDAIDGVRR